MGAGPVVVWPGCWVCVGPVVVQPSFLPAMFERRPGRRKYGLMAPARGALQVPSRLETVSTILNPRWVTRRRDP